MHEKATSLRSDSRTVDVAGTPEHLLLEIGRVLANAVEPEVFFGAVARGLRHFLQVDRTSLTLFDSERDHFELVALALQEESSLGKGSIIPHLGSRTGMAFDSRRPYVYALDARASFFEDRPLVGEGLSFAAQVPLIANGTCMGTLNTDVRRRERLSEADVELLCGIAGHIATALAVSSKRPGFVRNNRSPLNGRDRENASARLPQFHCPGIRPSMRSSLDRVMAIAKSDAIVLLLGETGTGKSIIARTIHDSSARKNKPFVKCDCAALSSQLIESELFGHEEGAFTGANARHIGCFEQANGGTLFLDEVAELPLADQAKLLGVLQDRQVHRLGGNVPVPIDVRVIAATNREIEGEVAAGRFRADLYYRLNVFRIGLPPLRQTLEDLEPLTRYFFEVYSRAMGRNIPTIDARLMTTMRRHSWPGNIRELENFAQRVLLFGPEHEFEPELFATGHVTRDDRSAAPVCTLEEVEAAHILKVLDGTRWRINGPQGAAVLLGLHPSTLRSRMSRLKIRRPARRPKCPEDTTSLYPQPVG